jgi:acyl-CoA thioesterase-2
MDERLAELLRLLELERIEENIFRGESHDIGSPQVFGGQVLGQALRAAYATVAADREAHSLHAYFLKRGDFNAPIVYTVDRSRDGGSFSSRRVTAIQYGEQMFHCSVSFQLKQPGLEHQIPMPDVPPPESLVDSAVMSEDFLAKLPEKIRMFYARARPFEFRLVHPVDLVHPAPAPPLQKVWIRAVDRLPDDDVLHRCLLAYVSDFYLLNTATMPHGGRNMFSNLVMASIDHAMWFHRAFRVDEWLLYAIDSPSASGSRGFSRGSFFTRDGRLVASTAQEGLMRVIEGSGAG